MFKNDLLKKTTLSLSLVALLSSTQVFASGVEEETVPGADAAVRASQNAEYAESLFTDAVLKNDAFQQSFDKYETLVASLSGLKSQQELSPKNEALAAKIVSKSEKVMKLRNILKKVYLGYLRQCGSEKIEPFMPENQTLQGVLQGLVASDEISLFSLRAPSSLLTGISPALRGLDACMIELEGSGLAPSVHPIQIIDLNEQFYMRFQGIAHPSFKEDGSDLDPEFVGFLKENKLGLKLMTDACNMQMLLRLFKPLTVNGIPTNNHDPMAHMHGGPMMHDPLGLHALGMMPHDMWSYQEICGSWSPFIERIAGVEVRGVNRGQIKFLFNDFMEELQSLRSTYCHTPGPEVQNPYHLLCDSIMGRVNECFFVDGRQVYNVSTQADAISSHMEQFLKVSRRVYEYALTEWINEGPILAGLIAGYEDSMTRLADDENGELYSGVATAPNCIALIETGKKEKAEDRAFLQSAIEKYFEEYKEKAQRYLQFKELEPRILKAKKWLDNIWDLLSQNGRIS